MQSPYNDLTDKSILLILLSPNDGVRVLETPMGAQHHFCVPEGLTP